MKKLFASTIFLLVACSNQAESEAGTVSSQTIDKLEIIFGMSPDNSAGNKKNSLFLVQSNGCTKSDDFRLEAVENNVIKIKRINPDQCRAMPHHVWISVNLTEGMTDTDPLHIANPFALPRFRILSP